MRLVLNTTLPVNALSCDPLLPLPCFPSRQQVPVGYRGWVHSGRASEAVNCDSDAPRGFSFNGKMSRQMSGQMNEKMNRCDQHGCRSRWAAPPVLFKLLAGNQPPDKAPSLQRLSTTGCWAVPGQSTTWYWSSPSSPSSDRVSKPSKYTACDSDPVRWKSPGHGRGTRFPRASSPDHCTILGWLQRHGPMRTKNRPRARRNAPEH